MNGAPTRPLPARARGLRAARALLPALLAALLPACAPLSVRLTPTTPTFRHYVAVGDSITAGFQSGGLTAASQQSAYPVLLGQRAGLSVTMPLVDDPGCPPPVSGRLPSSAIRGTCTRQDPDAVPDVVAVPGATVRDLLESTDIHAVHMDPLLYDPRLYRAVLGHGTTQMQAALALHPDFVTLWVGANDVLLPTLRGTPELATPLPDFARSYAEVLDRLSASGARVLVITVPDVTRVAALVPVRFLRLAGLVDASCRNQDDYFSSLLLAGASRERPLSCTVRGVLTQAEYLRAQGTVRAYNAVIKQLAEQHGDAVFDINPLLARLPGRPLIPPANDPFGPTFSGDGIHPSDQAHAELALALARFINRQYGMALRWW